MKPYFSDPHTTIYLADARELLPQLSQFDLVIADPPYGMNYQSIARRWNRARIVGDHALPVDLIRMAIDKANRAAYIFCRWDNLAEMPKPKSLLAWVKNNWTAGDTKHAHGRQWEACAFYPKLGHTFISRIPDVIVAAKSGNRHHPTEKPLKVLERIIGANVGADVLDPCMGSGSTLIAARRQGRRSVGIEIEERYCEAAALRLQQEARLLGEVPLAIGSLAAPLQAPRRRVAKVSQTPSNSRVSARTFSNPATKPRNLAQPAQVAPFQPVSSKPQPSA